MLAWFTLSVVLVSAPLSFTSYAIRSGDYPSGTVIAGIPWDSHFTDLRVSITNPTADDYHDIDLIVQPDRWNHKASILEENTGCLLTPMGGNSVLVVPSGKGGATKITGHRVGDNFEAEDNAGDVFEHFISEGGYRLMCAKFPAHFTVQIVFALACADQALMARISPVTKNSKPDNWSIGFAELKPNGAANKFDLLTPKPSTSVVALKGNYRRGVKGFSISCAIGVEGGK